MKSYFLPTLYFRKQWIWFEDPHEVAEAAMVTFFSYSDMEAPGFSKSTGVTSLIDLSKPIEQIWEGMRKKFIREQIERGERRGITVTTSEDFRSFYEMYARFREGKKLPREKLETLQGNGLLFIASYENKPIAGGVFIANAEHMRAWVLASERLDAISGRSRDIIGEANRLIVWHAIKYAKHNEYRDFDLGGIEPDSSLAEFKEGFGGTRAPQYYYTKVYSPLLKAWLKARAFVRR